MAFRFPRRDEPTRISVLLLIAASYFLTGQLALLLAIPPGYATAIWPPAGIALGCLLLWGSRYWIGVLLGSLLTNLVASLDATNYESILRSIMLATSIGGGAALQATFGAKLLRRFVDQPVGLVNERDVLRFFAIGGPAVHLTNATWGTTTLLVAGAIPATAFAQHWWTWWVGDTIGALIFAPLIVMWLSGDATWSSRRTVVTAPLLFSLLAAIALFMYTSNSDWDHLKQRFAEDSAELSAVISKRIDLDIETMHSAGGLLIAGQTMHREIDRETLLSFTEPVLARRSELLGLAWAPRVTAAQRRQFEFAVGQPIQERRDEHLVIAADREEYFPIRAAAPNTNAHDALKFPVVGFDAASDARNRDALAAALVDEQVAATAPPDRAQGTNDGDLWLVLPVYARPNLAMPSEAVGSTMGRDLRGYVIGVVQVSQLIATSLRDQPFASMIDLSIEDAAPGGAAVRPLIVFDSAAHADAMNFSHEVQIEVANRHWRARFTPTLDYLAARQTSSAWLVLGGGLLFTALIGAGALLITGRAQSIETLVAQRTTELAQINEKLADEICDHLSTEHALEKERELLRTVVNNLYEGIMVLDTAGELKMANGVAYRMLREVTGEDFVELARPRAFRFYAPDGVTELLPEQTPHYCALRGQTVSDFEMVVQAPGRAAMTMIVNAQPLLTNDHTRHGAIIVMRDITDSKAIERMKAEFVATVSHELRTPITSIRGSLGLIAGGVTGPLADKTRNLVEIALRNSDRLARLINDLLDMEKMETGKMQFELLHHSLTGLIEQAIEANSGYAQSFNIRFALQSAPAITVKVDSFRLLQVMNNLLSNAAKFSAPLSTVEIAIVDRIAMDGSRIARVQVTDYGPGIPEEFRARIFQKFSQADSSDKRAKSGTGLGLAICKAIIEQMGGRIGYETEVGVGSTFYFELPQTSATTSLQAAM
jgi:signal transduction histidine kinase